VTPQFFADPEALRAWFLAHADEGGELLLGYWKTGTGRPSVTWPQSVDEALCVGWIDGVRRRLDDESYVIRFTPRRPGSTWSAVNVARVAELTAQGRMQPAGLAAFEQRRADRSGTYADEQRETAALRPAHGDLVGGERQAGRDPGASARAAGGRLRARPPLGPAVPTLTLPGSGASPWCQR
jgi:hypothetical protein